MLQIRQLRNSNLSQYIILIKMCFFFGGGVLLENTFKFQVDFAAHSYPFDKYSLNTYYMVGAALVSREIIISNI